MDSILAEVVHLNKALVIELQNDLLVLINKHFFIQVSSPALSASCNALLLCSWMKSQNHSIVLDLSWAGCKRSLQSSGGAGKTCTKCRKSDDMPRSDLPFPLAREAARCKHTCLLLQASSTAANKLLMQPLYLHAAPDLQLP